MSRVVDDNAQYAAVGASKKSGYVVLSLILSVTFLAVDIADYGKMTLAREQGSFPRSWRFTILVQY